jgi:phage terminase large subunit
MRIIDTRGYIWGTMTPLMGLTWVHDLIYNNEQNDKEVKYWLMEWADNPHLSREEIAQLESTMSEEEREARQYGKFVALSGLVYKEFREEIHVIDPFDVPPEWYDKICIDPGAENPLSCHFYACDENGNVYVMAEHYQKSWSVEQHAEAIHRIARELKWPYTKQGNLKAMGDTDANKKTLAAEKSVTELFRENKIMLNTKIDKTVWTGIQKVKKYLKLRPDINNPAAWPKGKPKLFIFRTCPMMIKEIKNYRWQEDTEQREPDQPIKKMDHAMDDLRYYIMSKPDPYVPEEPPKHPVGSMEEKVQHHLERLIKEKTKSKRGKNFI